MKIILLMLFAFFYTQEAQAWGKRGHALICETAAYLSSYKNPKAIFLKQNSFDLAYYCNAPDLIWKRPNNYKKEFTNHFMNLESFEKEIEKENWFGKNSPFSLSRKEFNKKYKSISTRKGRSWWRIQELDKEVSKVTQKLKKGNLKKKEQQKLQEKWLTLVGITGHYIGDLAMPLHVSENYDGQMTNQKGIHHYFEETMVYELFLKNKNSLQEEVYKKSLKKWPKLLKLSKDKSLLEMIQDLSINSQSRVDHLLELDKKTGRKNLEKSLKINRKLVVERLSKGALYQAYFITRHLGWDFDSEKYYNFNEKPRFIDPLK